MKKFNFRFQKILDFKQTVEDLKRSNYASEVNALNQEKDKLDTLISSKKALAEERNNLAISTTIKDLKIFNTYLTQMNETINRQNDIINLRKESVNAAKLELIKSVTEKKTFEKLKDKDYEQHLFELKREEEKIVDQLVSFSNSIE